MAHDPTTPFAGFAPSNMTPVPDAFFDVLAPTLGEAELRVLLYIFRRTFGFKKHHDDISLRQLVDGIRRKDGTRLDHGAGVAKSAAVRAVASLDARGIISTQRNRSATKGDQPTTYALRFRSEPVSSAATRGSSPAGHGGVLGEDPQETGEQGTAGQGTALSNETISNGAGAQDHVPTVDDAPPSTRSLEPAPYLLALVTEFSADFGDAGHTRSNFTQVMRLYAASGLSEQAFAQRMFEARSIVRDEMHRRRLSGTGAPIRRAMPFWFATLRDVLGMRPPVAGPVPRGTQEAA